MKIRCLAISIAFLVVIAIAGYLNHRLTFGQIVCLKNFPHGTYRIRKVPMSLMDVVSFARNDIDASYIVEIMSGLQINSTYRAYWSSWHPKRIEITESETGSGMPIHLVVNFDDSYRVTCDFLGRETFDWK